jgi:DNA-binding SARP family transcriptional activator
VSSRSANEHLTGHTAPSLRVCMLGPPNVEWADRALAISRRQVRALLYRLAARLQPVPREHLCFLFWPDTPESTCRRNLSHLLTHLRHALPTPDVLLSSGDHVALDPDRVWSDTAAFERLCAIVGPHRRATTPRRGSGPALERAVNLYRGSFLPGFSLPTGPEFEAWAAQERCTWERLYLQALAALIEEHVARGAYDAAIAYAQRYLAADDLAEDVHRRLIRLYAAIGDRSAALRQFERCAAALERELGVSPLPETQAVYQAVWEGRPSTLHRPVARSAWTTLPGLDVPLVGREGALRRLERAYARARLGHGGVVLVSGESGIGKSRLMQDFATRCSAQALVLVGAGRPGAQAMPYQPVVEALRRQIEVGDSDRDRDRGGGGGRESLSRLAVAPVWLAEVSRLLPELRARYPDLPRPMRAGPDEARARLFEALRQFMLGLATGPRAVLLCLDDLHWADRVTLDWLAYLGRWLRGGPLLVVGAYRSEEAEAVAGLRHSLTRLGVLFEFRLEGLDRAAVLQVLRHVGRTNSRVRGDQALAGRLQRATGGNPFFLLETLRALIEAGRLLGDLTDGGDLPVSGTVRQAVKARLERLSAVAQQMLEAGAVLGETFGFDLVRLTAGRRELEAIGGLDELVARQLLIERALGYRFQHELIRRTVEEGLSPMRRRLLHRRAGRALERLEPDEVTALAYHFDASGEVEKAVRYHGLVAQRAESLFAWREAEAHQGRVLELLDQLDPGRTDAACLAQRGRMLAARAHLRYLGGRLAERDADLAALTELATTSGDERLGLHAFAHRVRYLNLDGRYGEAAALAEEGLALAGRLDDVRARCRFLAQIGFAEYLLGRPRPALAALESALVAAGEEADPEMRGRIVHILGYVHLHLGNHERALACQQEAYACHRTVGDDNRMAWDGLDIGFMYLKLGRLALADRHLTENLALARRIGARPAEGYGLICLGCWELYRGRYTAAAERFGQALSIEVDVGSRHGEVAASAGLGLSSYHLGDYALARRWLESAVERARSAGHRRRLVEALIGLGLVELADGGPGAAHRWLSEAVEVARASECPENLALGLAALARAERERGDAGRALDCASQAVGVAQAIGVPACEMWAEVEVGLALLAQGKPAAALAHTGRAVALVPQADECWVGTERAHRAHARVLRALGRAEAAEEQTRLADAVVERKASRIADPELRRR